MTDRTDYFGWPIRRDIMVLRSPHGDVQLPPTTLLVALDETGDETLADPSHPVFGMGGCAVLIGQYVDQLAGPWLRMKHDLFGGTGTRLHATDLRTPAPSQLRGLAEFFTKHNFFRFAVLVTHNTKLPAPQSRFELVVTSLLSRFRHLAQRVPFSKLALLCESSERTNARMGAVLRDLRVHRTKEGVTTEIPVEIGHADKQVGDSALEVADFIMHAAGTAVRANLTGTPFLARRDFRAVFGSVDPRWVEFLLLNSITAAWSVPNRALKQTLRTG